MIEKLVNRETGQKADLKRHIESVHEWIKSFKCNICDYETTCKFVLKKHIDSVHEGIKSHKCNICEYEFGQTSDKITHRICTWRNQAI